jgi:hypothetical protein
MIVRAAHDKDNPFFQMLRATAQDTKLPARALGVLAYLLSKPDSWEPTIDDICRRFSDVGRDQAYKIITEVFIPLRYARRTQERTDGKFARWLTEVHESPFPENQGVTTPDTDQPDTENQEMASQSKGRKPKKSKNVTPFPENQEAASPFPDLPDTEKPDTENQELYKKRKYKLQRKDITEGNTFGAPMGVVEPVEERTAELKPKKSSGKKSPLKSQFHNHPSVVAYRETLGFYTLNAAQADLIAEATGTQVESAPPEWLKFLRELAESGNKYAHNVRVMVWAFERYGAGSCLSEALDAAWAREKGRSAASNGNGTYRNRGRPTLAERNQAAADEAARLLGISSEQGDVIDIEATRL